MLHLSLDALIGQRKSLEFRVFIDRFAVREDFGLNHYIAILSLNTGYDNFRDERLLLKHKFYFLGEDVLAVFRDDFVLLSSRDDHERLLIEVAEITRVVESVLIDRFARRFFVFVVADHHIIAATENLTDAVLIGIEDLDIDTRQCQTSRLIVVMFSSIQRKNRRTFSQAVSLQAVDTEILHILKELLVNGSTACNQ